jgi:DNA-directed RNA polymerase specialized sigma24 family protein
MTNRRYYRLGAAERDEKIRQMRLLGFSYREIGKAVGMTANGVMHSLRRMAEGRPGLDPRA